MQLDGSASFDPDGDESLTYKWTQPDGSPTVTLSGDTIEMPNFTAPGAPTVLTFTLVVKNSSGLESDPDEVVITVVDKEIEDLTAGSWTATTPVTIDVPITGGNANCGSSPNKDGGGMVNISGLSTWPLPATGRQAAEMIGIRQSARTAGITSMPTRSLPMRPMAILPCFPPSPRVFNLGDGGIIDMGAYEFQGEPGIIPGPGNFRFLVSNAADFAIPGDAGNPDAIFKVEVITDQGSLLLDGETVSPGDEIPMSDLLEEKFTWSPPAGEHGYGFTSLDARLTDGVNEGDLFNITIDLAAASVELTGEEGWRLLTSPVINTSYADFLEPIWTQGLTGSNAPSVASSNIFIFDQEEFNWSSDFIFTDPVIPGSAFLVLVFSDDNFDDTPDGFPKTLTSEGQWMDLDGSFGFTGLDFNADEPNNSFFLLGNPHPVSVDFCQFERAELANNIFVWNASANNNEGDYELASCSGDGDVHIAPFQAFWVRTTAQNPSVSIPEQAYLGLQADGLFKQQEPENMLIISLQVAGRDGRIASETKLLLSDSGRLGLDEMDAPRLSSAGLAGRWADLNILDDDGNGYALRSLPAGEMIREDQNRVLPVSFQTSDAGSYELNWSIAGETHALFYIRDTYTGTLTELKKGGSYSFETEKREAVKTNDSRFEAGVPLAGGIATDNSRRFELIIAIQGLDELQDLPTQIALNQNYPNPFNPSTIIAYELPRHEHVKLSVYDMTGRQVAILVNEQLSAGRHQVSFNAMNLASGVYMYRLQAGGTMLTRQLTLIK